jgi:hypothetical protein
MTFGPGTCRCTARQEVDGFWPVFLFSRELAGGSGHFVKGRGKSVGLSVAAENRSISGQD